MLLDCGVDLRRYPRGTFERLRIALAHLVYRRIALLGDRPAAIAAMGAFYGRTSGPPETAPTDLDAAVNTLTAVREPDTGESIDDRRRAAERERLLLAALRVGCTVVRAAREAPDTREVMETLRRLDGRTLDARLTELLSERAPDFRAATSRARRRR